MPFRCDLIYYQSRMKASLDASGRFSIVITCCLNLNRMPAMIVSIRPLADSFSTVAAMRSLPVNKWMNEQRILYAQRLSGVLNAAQTPATNYATVATAHACQDDRRERRPAGRGQEGEGRRARG